MLIYGRNATGKTNLGRALLDIVATIFSATRFTDNGILLNADSNEDAAIFQYYFRFENAELCYKYSRLSNQELRDEELLINGKKIFKCKFDLEKYDFDNLDYISAETANIDRYLQSLDGAEEDGISEPKLPFLRWLISNVALKNDSVLIRLSKYVRRMM